MTITLPDDLKLEEMATAAGFADVSDYVADLVEREEIRAAIKKGLEAAERGDVQPAREALADIRRDLGLSDA